jgi:hypothetical protein
MEVVEKQNRFAWRRVAHFDAIREPRGGVDAIADGPMRGELCLGHAEQVLKGSGVEAPDAK